MTADAALLDQLCVARAMRDLAGLDWMVVRYTQIAWFDKHLAEIARAYSVAVDATRLLIQRHVRTRDDEDEGQDWATRCEWYLALFVRLLPFYYRAADALTNRSRLGGSCRVVARTDTALLFRTDACKGTTGVRGTIQRDLEVQLQLATRAGKQIEPVRLATTDPLHWVQPWDASVLSHYTPPRSQRVSFVPDTARRFWDLVNQFQAATRADQFVPLGGALYACYFASLLCPVTRALVTACTLFLARAARGPQRLGQCEAAPPPSPGVRWDPTYLRVLCARPVDQAACDHAHDAVAAVELCALDGRGVPATCVVLRANASGRLCGFPTDRIQHVEGGSDAYVQCVSAWIGYVTHSARDNDEDVLGVHLA